MTRFSWVLGSPHNFVLHRDYLFQTALVPIDSAISFMSNLFRLHQLSRYINGGFCSAFSGVCCNSLLSEDINYSNLILT